MHMHNTRMNRGSCPGSNVIPAKGLQNADDNTMHFKAFTAVRATESLPEGLL